MPLEAPALLDNVCGVDRDLCSQPARPPKATVTRALAFSSYLAPDAIGR
jgi:hypothetical protein